MPLYVYHCNECGDDFEKMVRFSEADLIPACPACLSQDTKKRSHGFQLLARRWLLDLQQQLWFMAASVEPANLNRP
jgi:putative FmdB family regulatory protein